MRFRKIKVPLSENSQLFSKLTGFRIITYFLFAGILFIAGLVAGRNAGNQIIGSIIKGGNTSIILYRLPFEYFYTSNLLSSQSELIRLQGYYSMLDSRKIDTDFLIQRYYNETGINKPTIIWLLGFSKDHDKVISFISDELPKADSRLKQEMLKTLERFDKQFNSNFSGPEKK
jgi:hypothetical protein